MDDYFYKRIVDHLQIGYAYHKIIYSEDGIPCDFEFLEVNLAFEKLTGIKGSDIIGKAASVVLPEIKSDQFNWMGLFAGIAANGSNKEFNQFFRATNRWIKIRAYSPQQGYFITLYDDPLKHGKIVEVIVDDPEYFDMIFEEYPAAILTMRLNDGLIMNANTAFAKHLGYSREELIGRIFYEADIIMDAEHYKKMNTELAEKGTFHDYEYTFRRKDGSIFTALISGKMVHKEAGLYGLYNIHDIDARKKAEEALKASETRYRRLFESAKDGIIILDAETGMIKDVNPYLIHLLGYSKEQFIDKAIWDIGLFKDRISNRDNFLELQNNEYIRYEDMPLQTADGHPINVEFISNVYPVNGDKVIQCNIRDITYRKIAEKALIESEKKYSDYIENAPQGVLVVDENGRYVDVNRAGTGITGYSKEELLTMNISDITTEESIDTAMTLFKELTETGSVSSEFQFTHKNGSTRWWSVDAVKLKENRYLSFSSDITDKKKAEDDLIYFGNHDILTGLYNRRFHEEELKKLDTKTNLPLSIIICDINGLKWINDSYGHDFGDDLLVKTAETIKKACRADDIVSRIGGDEFAVILLHTNAEETMEIANNIKELASKIAIANIQLSISYGYDTKENEKKDIREVFAIAENHMHRHKLYERSSLRSKTIDLVMNTLFEKSIRESMHSSRVGAICEAIAYKMNFDRGDVNKMRIAGLIHDIGKIGIDEKILNKAGRLTADERIEIERHPEIGYRILSSTIEFSELAQIVLDHHERWDGGGYPNGLKGKEIPIEARIISVADSYDAMTSERSYKAAVTQEEAINELKRCSGTQYDPEVVEAFMSQTLPDAGYSVRRDRTLIYGKL